MQGKGIFVIAGISETVGIAGDIEICGNILEGQEPAQGHLEKMTKRKSTGGQNQGGHARLDMH